jgi:hypothetical protein
MTPVPDPPRQAEDLTQTLLDKIRELHIMTEEIRHIGQSIAALESSHSQSPECEMFRYRNIVRQELQTIFPRASASTGVQLLVQLPNLVKPGLDVLQTYHGSSEPKVTWLLDILEESVGTLELR